MVRIVGASLPQGKWSRKGSTKRGVRRDPVPKLFSSTVCFVKDESQTYDMHWSRHAQTMVVESKILPKYHPRCLLHHC